MLAPCQPLTLGFLTFSISGVPCRGGLMEVSLLLSVKDDGERMRGRTVQEVC